MNGKTIRARAVSALALLYVSLFPFPWPPLPLNMRLVDALFPLLAVLLLWDGDLRRALRRRLTLLDWCVLALLVAAGPSLFVTADLRTSVVALVKRLYVAAVFFVFAAYFERFGVRAALSAMVRTAMVLSAVCATAALAYLALGFEVPALGAPAVLPYFGRVLRLSGGTETPGMFGNYLTFVWPIACVLAWQAASRGWWLAGLAAIALAMVLTVSHAVAGYAAATVVVAWSISSAPAWRFSRTVLAAAAVVLIVTVNLSLIWAVRSFSAARDHDRDIPRVVHGYGLQTTEGADRITFAVSYNPMSYYLLKKVAFDAFRAHPLTGVGLGTFHGVAARALEAGLLPDFHGGDDPHSTVFGALAETGVLGALAAVALFVAALVLPTGTPDAEWLALSMKAAVVGIAINSLNADVLNFRFLWIGLAALRALAR